jgi:tetratricopeptide (TPR) repeat protein
MEHASSLCFDAMLTFDDAEAFRKFHRAKDAYLALEPCEKVWSALGNIFNRLGNLEYVDEEYEEAMKFYKQSAEYYEKSVQLKPAPDTYCYFAEACVKIKDDRASDLFIEAMELGSKRACLQYGWFLHQKKEFHSALFYYRLADKDDEELSTTLHADILFKIGLIYHERFITDHIQSHFDKAETNYEDANKMLVKGHPDAERFLPILRSGLIAHFWMEHKRLTNK